MEKKKKHTSVRRKILLTFIITLIISVGFYGLVVYSFWISSAKRTTNLIATDVNESIYDNIYNFIHAPYKVIESNHKIIENGMLDLSNDVQRNHFFADTIDTQAKGVYSFSYGTIAGEYYGARRNEDGEPEINICSEATNWHSFYYSINPDGTVNEFVSDAGAFDPRTRAWYIAAVENKETTYSLVYKHFVVNDLAVSVAKPIYNENSELQGVLSVSLLLTDVGEYLNEAVKDYMGVGIIVEKDTHELVANSLGVPDFTILSEGTLQRYKISDIQDEDIQNAYVQYLENENPSQIYKGLTDNYFVNVKELDLNGVNWMVISAIPESIFMKNIFQTMFWSALVAVFSLLVLIIIYNVLMKRRMKPIKTLLRASQEFSKGNLKERIEITYNDEIGVISNVFNGIADELEILVSNLEDTVKKRTEELNNVNIDLEENKNALQLILNSVAEGIYGMDLEGNGTFSNPSCIKLLGYEHEDELLGKNMHLQIHHHHKDGRIMLESDCKISAILETKKGVHVEDEVFWKKDGTSFEVEYFAYPQIKNGEIVGVVVTFMDISKRKQREADIEYLSCYDTLTGFHNRSCFEKNKKNIDIEANLPLSIIFADINGLKMTNDIFGHSAGDRLIKESAQILQHACRQNDLIARLGGDEFVIILPKTGEEATIKILNRIKEEFENAYVEAIKCSISLGYDIKTNPDQSFDEVIANAENAMYKDKTLNRKTINKNIIDTIIETLHKRNPKEKRHSSDVTTMCTKVGFALKL
ncbi:MAG: diguanylate cyclase, partial [Bacilli bacterium]|nr:diguanylate cyclase [Bacilli bacterium]